MSDIQLENGYTRIAHELLQIIYGTDFNATQFKIILLIIRFTYGYHKKEANLSLAFISKGTGISKRYVSSELGKLIDGKVVIVTQEHTDIKSRKLKINKDHKSWVGYRTILQQVNNSSTDEQKQTKGLNNPSTPQVNNSSTNKDNNKDNNKDMPIDIFFEKIWAMLPRKMGKKKVSEKQKKYLFDEIGENLLVKAIKLFNKEMAEKESRFIPYGSTFLNSGYADYLEKIKAKEKKKKRPSFEIEYVTDEDLDKMADEKHKKDLEKARGVNYAN